jgi:predicted MFS family arabinose efflux permease
MVTLGSWSPRPRRPAGRRIRPTARTDPGPRAQNAAVFVRYWQGYARSLTGLSREVWVLAAVMFLNRCGFVVVPFFGLYLTQARGFSALEMGRTMALAGVGSLLGSLLGGWASDRFGPFRVQVASLLLSIPLYLALGQARSPLAIGALLFTTLLVVDALRPANSAAIAQHSTPETRARSFGLLRLSVNLGWTVGPTLAGFLAATNYGLLFRCNAVAVAVAAVTLVCFGRRRAEQGATHEVAEEALPDAYRPWRDGRLLAVLGCVFLAELCFFQFLTTWPLYLREQRGLDERAVGALFAVNTLLIVLFELPLTRAIQRRAPLPMVALGMAVAGVGFGLTPLASGFLSAAVTVAVWTLGEMLQAPQIPTWIAARCPPALRGRTLGLYTFTHALAFSCAPLCGTFAYQRLHPAAPWFLCLALSTATALALLAVARREPRAPR